MQKTWFLALTATVIGLVICLSATAAGAQAAGDESATPPAISNEEVTAEVPALDALHDVVFELWHDAFPDKNVELIKELLPRADELTASLDAAALPGILRDKQAAWDEGKGNLKEALAALHAAADAADADAMLKQTEAFHAAFEVLVRTIRPAVPELDAFHQELYKLYHYHAPEYDLEAIRAAASAMKERVAPLAAATLPKRVADRQEKFESAVAALATAVDGLVDTVKKDDKDAVLAAVEKVHTAYVSTEAIFD